MMGWEKQGYTSDGYTPTWVYGGGALLALIVLCIISWAAS